MNKKLQRIDTKELNDNHFFITDGKNVIYIEKDRFSGLWNISTTHQPNRTTGTGFRIAENVTDAKLLSSIDLYLNTFAPTWASQKDIESVKKWETLEQFLNYERKFWGENIFINDLKLKMQ